MNTDAYIELPGSVRGIIATRNQRGQRFDLTVLKKWIKLNRRVFHTAKMDVLVSYGEDLDLVGSLLDFARAESMALSVRMPVTLPMAPLEAWQGQGLLDVFLHATSSETELLQQSLEQCAELHITARVQLNSYFGSLWDLAELNTILGNAAMVNIAAMDPFVPVEPCAGKMESGRALKLINELAGLLRDSGVPVNLLHFPFCWIDESLRDHTENHQQYLGDQQQYQQTSLEFAEKAVQCSPRRLRLAVENLLGREQTPQGAIDRKLFPWLIRHPWIYARMYALHALTRYWPRRKADAALPETDAPLDSAIRESRLQEQATLSPVCAQCCFHPVCDHVADDVQRCFRGMERQAIPGPPLKRLSPVDRSWYMDAIDEARMKAPPYLEALAQTAREVTSGCAPTREIAPEDYAIEDRYTQVIPGAVRWLAFSAGEYWSTPLARLEPPFTLQATFGGGIADQIGFCFGRHTKIMCPMLDVSHRLTLYVNEAGYYALLRDTVSVQPTSFYKTGGPPERLSGVLEPRIAIQNINGQLLTQTVQLWEGGRRPAEAAESVKYSLLIINTRFSRRLQAALLSLVHQEGIDIKALEVVVAYVPGLDATDDLLDTVQRAHPDLRVVRSTFHESQATAKGFMINESLKATSGEWVILMDADIVLPPDTFRKVEAVEQGSHFIAPEGRVMLSQNKTARILLGELRPWEHMEEILDGETDVRAREAKGVPIGFFQCVRREIALQIPQAEFDHFEAADWQFGKEVREGHGPETRLENLYVLHLDHSGSQWFGTERHR